MANIKLKRITFGAVKFRRLANITIDIADRLTVIAGHNGIGKSTIMGLIANNSGLTGALPQTYKERSYQANLTDIFHIDYEKEFRAPKERGETLPAPIVEYLINDTEPATKVFSLTDRIAGAKRAARLGIKKVRVVPRNQPHSPFKSEDGSVTFGSDAKLPLPTLFVGMSRMHPIGEVPIESITHMLDESMHPADKKFFNEFVNKVIEVGEDAPDDSITTQKAAGNFKNSKHPAYGHSSLAASLGQESLSDIATALASFHKLEREDKANYPGGLLVIDEVDAGFHPRAQRNLVIALQSAARKLKLQIVVTTHSMVVIEGVHPDSSSAKATSPDAVVYLMDKAQPYVANLSLEEIRADMHLLPPKPALKQKVKKDVLKIYFEDEEAAYVFERVAPASVLRALAKQLGVKIKPMPLGLGCNNLLGLSKHDPYFKQVVIALDADHTGTKPRNAVSLPGEKLSPERMIIKFVRSLHQSPAKHKESWEKLKALHVTTAHLKEYLLDDVPTSNDREPLKKWWKATLEHVQNWQLWELWAGEHPEEVAEFQRKLTLAATAAQKHLGR